MRETRVQSLGWEGLLEKEIAIHSSILAWKIPWKEESGRLQSMGSQRVRHDWATFLLFMAAKVLRAHIYKSENRKRIDQQFSFIMASSTIYPQIWEEWYSQVALVVKNLPVNQCRTGKRQGFDPWVGKDPLEEGMVTHLSILAWRIPRTEEPGGLQSIGLQSVGHNWSDLTCTHMSFLLFNLLIFHVAHFKVFTEFVTRLLLFHVLSFLAARYVGCELPTRASPAL